MAKSVLKQYLSTQEPAQREVLEELVELIQGTCPTAEVKIAWGMPVFTFVGDLVGICGFKKHVSLFPMGANLLEGVGPELEDFRTSKGTLQFPLGDKLPKTLIKKILKLRMAQNVEKASTPPVKDGLNHGKAKEFYRNGTLKSEGAWRRGELHGEWKWYRQNGTLMRTGNFKDGEQVGTWQTFDRAGKLVKTTEFGR